MISQKTYFAGASAEFYYFKDDGKVPNSRLPVLVYRRAIDTAEVRTKAHLQELVDENGWKVDWVENNAVLPYVHYHTWAHEILVVLKGGAKLRLGGKKGRSLDVAAGDVIAIPAGVAHQRIDTPVTFRVAGMYLQRWNMCYEGPEEYARAKKEIPLAKLPTADPIYGVSGPLVKYWTDLSKSIMT